MTFNKLQYIEKMTPHIKTLVEYFNSKGITFQPNDDLENVIFTKGDKVIKIAHQCFYRFSGLCKIRKEIGRNQLQLIDVTDNMYINEYMKSVIEYAFTDKEKL